MEEEFDKPADYHLEVAINAIGESSTFLAFLGSKDGNFYYQNGSNEELVAVLVSAMENNPRLIDIFDRAVVLSQMHMIQNT